jgi:hypothetical protein
MKTTPRTRPQIPHATECGSDSQRPLSPARCDGCCFIIPSRVLERFARDKELPEQTRKAFADAAAFDKEWRKVRVTQTKLSMMAKTMLPAGLVAAAAGPPQITVFDCAHAVTLPGTLVANPGSSADGTAKRAFVEAAAVADFY